ncbi:MAG TPA: hypothetical protein VK631_18580, partial [Solirubrobacteraceae bacterium]|nr:hypothetical protein [Solirubrobacteraceae bacterium]
GQRGGRYWFTAGLNLRAVGAWAPASVIGVLFSAAPPVYTGPWANAADGIDLSFLSAGVVGGVLYLAFLWLFPEPAAVFGPDGPAQGRSADAVAPTAAADAVAAPAPVGTEMVGRAEQP